MFAGTIVGATTLFLAGALRLPATRGSQSASRAAQALAAPELASVASRVNQAQAKGWRAESLEPAAPADDLTVMRRLSLALCGTAPSLEEIRRFEAEPKAGRVDRYLDQLLADRRSAGYLSERFARAFVGVEGGPFLVYRRGRFKAWLADQFQANRPFDAIVRDLIAQSGLWMDRPATNFVTVTQTEETERPDPERLAARVSRAFLGVRLDCAQCHDHPFREWKQADFRGLAAFFGSVRANIRGVRDEDNVYQPPDRKTKAPTTVAPAVPFFPELLPAQGGPRERLAAWVVDPRNDHLARAVTNRMWALLFGRPLVEPIDDLPPVDEQPEALGILAADFAAHNYDLKRLIRTISRTQAFRLDSQTTDAAGPSEAQEAAWAVFPMTRLRPEQVAGSVFQGATLSTIGPESSWVVRLVAYTSRNDFVRRYGDAGEDEFDPRGGTIPQRLLLMNGNLVRDKVKPDLFNATLRIAQQARDDRQAIEAAYLTVLTRRPSEEELAHFRARLASAQGDARGERLADLMWALMNSTEFSWNH
jgi:hypothetical protein